ncbi:MAG: hypothetical protein R3E72_08120 [Steroidobacteraceae bacterium]|jgi:hypothetical protein
MAVTCSAAILALGAASTTALAKDADSVMSPYIGYEITIDESEQEGHVPTGGKLTLIYDSEDDVYRACTRSSSKQKSPWQEDWRTPCGVALNLVKGNRYCSMSDVKAGNAEVLSTCHRLRSRDVAMHPSTVKGGLELHDVMVFLLQPEGKSPRGGIAMLLDSPARVTHNGIIHGVPD